KKEKGGENVVLGINDPWVWSAYILTVLSMLLCVGYGLLNWNKGGEDEEEEIKEEMDWHKKEKEMEEEELGIWDEEG
ncbi:MAG: symporter small accessory protein, partial [Methanobacterium sp.]